MSSVPRPPSEIAGRPTRSAGVLAHPTSLGGPGGVGDLGATARRFLDRAVEAGIGAWQLLPLGPTGPDRSPYAGLSSRAGNPLLVSLRELERRGWLPRGAARPDDPFDPGQVEFARVASWKRRLLRTAWDRFERQASNRSRRELERFIEHPHQRGWLDDWTLFAALRERYRGRPWFDWDAGLRDRHDTALDAARRELVEAIAFQRFVQFLFFRQWSALRNAARRRGIRIVGDLPFYLSHDSADVWSRQDLFRLDPAGRATRVGGVPPDYFSETGQRWGNPTFDWPRLAAEGYGWWIDRLEAELRRVDIVRLDHFRGFAAYWEIDAAEPDAVRGRWVPGPGDALFEAARRRLGTLPLIAEDLGLITEDVDALRDRLELPGMHVLQFAFGDAGDGEPTAHHAARSVVYTGTHDNDTTRGWFDGLDPSMRRRVLERTGATAETVVRTLIELAYRSPAQLAVIPLQDLLELGGEARMNRPGSTQGNWSWRVRPGAFSSACARRLRRLADSTGRGRS